MLTKRVLPILLCINLALLAFYLIINYQLVYHSDSAVKNLLAQEMLDTGQYFPQDWNYANGDLWVFNTQTLVLALLPFLRNDFMLHAASDLVSAALILGASWLLTGLLEQGRAARLTGMLVMSAGMSLIMAEHIFGQAAYGSLYYMACFLIYAYWSLCQARGGRALMWGAALALLALQVAWTNPQRAMLFYMLPLLAAGALQQVPEWRAARAAHRAPDRRPLHAIGVLLAGTLAGLLLHRYTMLHVNNHQGLAALNWRDFDGMLANLGGVVHGVLMLFDGLPRLSASVTSVSGAYAALRLVGALALVLLLPWALYRTVLASRPGPRQMVAVFTAVTFSINLFVMLTTSLTDPATPDGSVRYLVPSLLMMLLILVGFMLERRAVTPLARVAGIGAIALLATSAPMTYVHAFHAARHWPHRGMVQLTPDQQLTDFLAAQGLRYGYASFWNAGKLSVLSGGTVRVRQVLIERGMPVPMRKLSSNRWYNPQMWRGETFLMLRDAELGALNQPLLASYAGQPRRLRFQDMNVLVYPGNLAASLPSWDTTLNAPVHYRMDESALHQVGTIADGVLAARRGEAGTLYFGPMRTLSPGAYEVSFDIEAGEAGGPAAGEFGVVDICTNSGNKIHARQILKVAGRQRVSLRFATASTLDMTEFRVFTSGFDRLALRGIDVRRVPPASIAAAAAAQEKP